MIQRAECPECKTSYTLKRLGAVAEVGREYTVSCATCQTVFQVTFKRHKRIFGLIGTYVTDVVTE